VKPIEVLLQTTIEPTANDWHIGRFSMLRDYLGSLTAADGSRLCNVTARDRESVGAPDPILSALDESAFDELWLFAVDTGNGLDDADREGILRFRARGGGIMITRDHMDLGCSICNMGSIGAAHVFHTHNIDGPLPPPDDRDTTYIGWPNFHSGANGDFQAVAAELPVHPVMRDVKYLPAHPHEGAVVAPQADSAARVIATGKSLASGQRFNIAVAFEPSPKAGPAIAESTFHHFADYNWDPRRGSPDFVTEPPGDTLPSTPQAMASVQRYVRNLALWLAGRNTIV
jgi:hypothetical protein